MQSSKRSIGKSDRREPLADFDVIIIGAGMAGCILAAKLAERGLNRNTGKRLRIALIEAGPYLRAPARPGYGAPLRRQLFTNLRDEDSANLNLVWPWGEGRMVGGSTFHWQAIVGLPDETESATWSRETGVDWNGDALKRAVSEVRRTLHIQPAPDEAVYEGQKRFAAAAQALGYVAQRLEHARKNCFYCGYCGQHQFCKYDARGSPAFSYLPTAEKFGVKVIPDAEVERLVIERSRGKNFVRGLVYREAGTMKRASAEKVVVSCGTVGTTVLLKRSGYGSKKELGKDLLVENPNVGEHVDAHPSGHMVAAYFEEPIKETAFGSVPGYYLLIDENADGEDRLIITDGIGEMAYPEQVSLSEFAPPFGREHKRFMRKASSRLGALYVFVARPGIVRGRINLQGQINYEVHHGTITRKLLQGELVARKLLTEMGAAEISKSTVQLSSTLMQEVHQGQATMEGGTGHEVASCRAGVDPTTSVVNPNFESHDIGNLFICDASVIPRVPTIGCGATVATIAVFASERMIANHFSKS